MTNKRTLSESFKVQEEMNGRPITLGSLIESIRFADDATQAAYAKKLDISLSLLREIEKGRELVSPEHAVKIAKLLGYSERQFARLALQALIDQSGLDFKVDVKLQRMSDSTELLD